MWSVVSHTNINIIVCSMYVLPLCVVGVSQGAADETWRNAACKFGQTHKQRGIPTVCLEVYPMLLIGRCLYTDIC